MLQLAARIIVCLTRYHTNKKYSKPFSVWLDQGSGVNTGLSLQALTLIESG